MNAVRAPATPNGALSALDTLHRQTRFEWVPVGAMFAAPYERPLSQSKVDHLLAHWDVRAVGVLYVAERPTDATAQPHSPIPTYALLDGRHRKEAAQQQGVMELPALIYQGLTYEDEAALYVLFATVHQQTSLDRFRARLEAGEPLAVELRQLVEDEAKLELPLTTAIGGTGYLHCVYTIEQLHRRFGSALLRDTFRTLRAVWSNQQRAWGTSMVGGMAHFLARYQDHEYYDEARLFDKLRQTTPESVIADARIRSRAWRSQDSRSALGGTMLDYYNEGLRSKRLPEWQTRVYTQTPEGNVVSFGMDE